MVPDNEFNDPNTAILLKGKIYNKNCQPLADATVDIWYAGGNPGTNQF